MQLRESWMWGNSAGFGIRLPHPLIGSHLRACAPDPSDLYWPQMLLPEPASSSTPQEPSLAPCHAGSLILGPGPPGSGQHFSSRLVWGFSPSDGLHSAPCLPCVAPVTLHCRSPMHLCEVFEGCIRVQFFPSFPRSGI